MTDVQLFHDYAFLHDESASDPKYVFGTVVRIQCKNTDYVRPVPRNHDKNKDIRVTVEIFKSEGGQVYSSQTERLLIPFRSILCNVEFDYDPDSNTFSISQGDEEAIASLALEETSKENKRKTPKQRTVMESSESSFGLVRTEVQPQQSANRRSERVRTAVYCPHAFF